MPIREEESPTQNPYWDAVRTLPGDFILSSDVSKGWAPALFPEVALLLEGINRGEDPVLLTQISKPLATRDELVNKYAWAIPDPRTLKFIQGAFPEGTQFVENGAGTGYWAWQLKQLGFEVTAYDKEPRVKSYHPVSKPPKGSLEGEVLFLCWPPRGDSMAYRSLLRYTGETLLHIGEYKGCTASDDFFEELEGRWTLISSHPILSYSGLHDSVDVYKRNG